MEAVRVSVIVGLSAAKRAQQEAEVTEKGRDGTVMARHYAEAFHRPAAGVPV